jgi:hypothetical protein
VNNLLFYRDCVDGDGGVATMEMLEQAFAMKGDRPARTHTVGSAVPALSA